MKYIGKPDAKVKEYIDRKYPVLGDETDSAKVFVGDENIGDNAKLEKEQTNN